MKYNLVASQANKAQTLLRLTISIILNFIRRNILTKTEYRSYTKYQIIKNQKLGYLKYL